MVKLQTLAAGSPASPLILSHNPSFFCEDGENATYLFWKLDGAHCGELEVFTKRSHFSVSHFHELTQFGTILCSSLCKKKSSQLVFTKDKSAVLALVFWEVLINF